MHGLLVRLRVRDFGEWRTAFDEQESVRRAYGCRAGRVFQRLDEQDDVMILLEWDDANRAWMFAQSDDLWMALASASTSTSAEEGLAVWLFEDAHQVCG